jgi:hypothetical protein
VVYVSCRNVLWILGLGPVLALAESSLGIEATRPYGTVADSGFGARPSTSGHASEDCDVGLHNVR